MQRAVFGVALKGMGVAIGHPAVMLWGSHAGELLPSTWQDVGPLPRCLPIAPHADSGRGRTAGDLLD